MGMGWWCKRRSVSGAIKCMFMKNTVSIHSDDRNVYLTSTLKVSHAKKVTLTIVNISLVLLHIFFIIEIELHEVKRLLIPTIVSMVVFIYFPWRYWCWSFFGQEYLTINTKTITYQYNYGIVKTHARTLSHRGLASAYTPRQAVEGEACGRLIFISEKDGSDKTEAIYETEIVLPKKDLDHLKAEITELFLKSARTRASA